MNEDGKDPHWIKKKKKKKKNQKLHLQKPTTIIKDKKCCSDEARQHFLSMPNS